MPLSELTVAVESCLARNKLIILDCCNALAGMRSWRPEPAEAYRLLAASRTFEEAKELDALSASLLTYYLWQGLIQTPSEVFGATGMLTVNSLYEWVRSKADDFSASSGINLPVPRLMGDQGADFSLIDTTYSQISDTSSFSSLDEYIAAFLRCSDNCLQRCYGQHLWCRALSESILHTGGYVVPRLKVAEEGALKETKADTFLHSWIQGLPSYHVALLGDSGIGKTSACVFIFRLLAKTYVSDPKSLIPLFVPLEIFARKPPASQGLATLMKDLLRLNIDATIVHNLARAGRFLFLLDGFDEMCDAANLSRLVKSFFTLKPFLVSQSRALLTCRTQYFASTEQVEEVLLGGAGGTDLARHLQENHSAFHIVELQDFSPDEIKEVIHLRFPDRDEGEVWDQISTIYDLKDLSRRAILLKLILETLPELLARKDAGEQINRCKLYRTYVQRWIRREMENKGLDVDPDEKWQFFEHLAVQMWTRYVNAINHRELKGKILSHYKSSIFSQADLLLHDYDTRSASFLTRDSEGHYRYIHKSFMEYFAAQMCLREAEHSTPHMKSWKLRWFDKEVASFIAEDIQAPAREAILTSMAHTAGIAHNTNLLWNVLHILSLVNDMSFRRAAQAEVVDRLVHRAKREKRSVIIRQYCRVIARFVSMEIAEHLISQILLIVRADPKENSENNRTYINYYGGQGAAAEAMLVHLSSAQPKYDRRLHIHVLGELGADAHADRLERLVSGWANELHISEARQAIIAMRRQERGKGRFA